MANTRIQQVTNTERTPAYDVTKEIAVTPKEESKSTSLSMPTDPALQQELQRQIQAAQRAYGVNQQTGAITPFEALGYNPEDERKRREAERALNDRKRKENAWYNAFAVLGDSLTAALGGNVWQRQPNNIGAKANADNARLIAEQKAEDEGNAAKLRAAGTAYANMVNKLLQNYLTKTTNTTTTGGNRKETTHHPKVSKTRQVAFPLGDGNGSGSSRSRRATSSSSGWRDDDIYEVGLKSKDGVVDYSEITGKEAKHLIEIARKVYGDALNSDNAALSEHILRYLGPSVVWQDAQGNYKWNDANLLESGVLFDTNGFNSRIDAPIRQYYSQITGDKKNYEPVWDIVAKAEKAARSKSQSTNTTRTTGSQGRITKSNPNDRAGRR